jgi:protein subunit release factor A
VILAKHRIFSVTIKDCDVQSFRAGGKGGQHQNKTETGIRVVHAPSGAIGESRETRSQLTNKRSAFKRMAESAKFQSWLKRQIGIETVERSTRGYHGYGSRYLRTYDFMDRNIKDHDTGHVRHDVESVMNGDIDSFINARMVMSQSNV